MNRLEINLWDGTVFTMVQWNITVENGIVYVTDATQDYQIPTSSIKFIQEVNG